MSGRDRERRKGATPKAAAEKTLHAPDKNKFERSVSEIGSKIRDLETQRKQLSSQGGQRSELNAEFSKLSAILADIAQQKAKTTTEARKVEEQVKQLGPDITSKKAEASRLLVSLRYKSEERIDDAVGKLRQQLMTRQYSGSEERKLQTEIDNLEGSKERLREYLSTKAEIDGMIEHQGQLRERRNSLYRVGRELRGKEGEVKDQQEALRRQMSELRDKKKDLESQKDALTKEIDLLYKERQRLRDDFRRDQAQFLTANSEQSQRETEEREKESQRRGEERRARQRRQFLEAEMQREMQYDEEKTSCKTLISHLQKLLKASSTATDINGDVRASMPFDPQRSRSSPATLSVGSSADTSQATATVRDSRESAEFKKPGEFLPRKTDDVSGYLLPTSSRKRSKRDKKRHAPSGKAPRSLQYDHVVLSRFAFLSISPPATHSHIPQVLRTLQEKLVFYEHKSSVAPCSEAGDSGIESQALGDVVSEQELNSQEEYDPTSLSPNRRSLDPLSLSSDHSTPHDNAANLSPSPSTPVVSLDPKTLHHSFSNSTNASSNSSSTALLAQINDE